MLVQTYRRLTSSAIAALLLGLAAFVVPAVAQAGLQPAQTAAVVLVSGFSTSTPFSTSAPDCAGKEGETWSVSVAPTLKRAGLLVFTSPQGEGAKAPAPCVGSGEAIPPPAATIDTGGDVDANGKALATFLAFLRDRYGVTSVQLVGHSDGGIWSRAAITQSSAYAPLSVSSLTTLGTPHDGAYIADIAQSVHNGQCDITNEIEQLVCQLVKGVVDIADQELGPTALAELTDTYMATWNPKQTIGSCAVTTIAGNYVNLPIPSGLLSDYYNPSDALVGTASAHARPTKDFLGNPIAAPSFANRVDGGTYPVVHSATLSFLSPKTLLNQADISARVLQAIRASDNQTAQPCNVMAVRAGVHVDRPVTLTVPLRSIIGVRSARLLPRPRRGDVLIGRRGVAVRCGRRAVVGNDAPGVRGLVMVPLPRCDRALTVSGGRGLLLRSDPTRRLRLTVRGSSVRARLVGPKVRTLEHQVRVGGRWRTLRPGSDGAVKLPSTGGRTDVRVLVRVQRGAPRLTAVASIDR